MFLQVFKCLCLLNNEYYALKEIPKLKLTSIKHIYSSFKESFLLKQLIKYEFILKIISSFQDYDNLYLVTNLFEGDVLYNYKDINLTEKQIRFISACIIQSLAYLRKKKIINRDIRMKNIIMDKQRYLNLIDFSFAIDYTKKNNIKYWVVASKNESAPEIMNHSSYDYNSDYYRMGTILYYLIFKQYVNFVKKGNYINDFIIDYKTTNFSFECIDFINKLIINDNKKRIGYKSINELKYHNWFKGFDWKNFERKKLISPLKFMKKTFNKTYCKRHRISRERKIKHQKLEKRKFYKKILRHYDYVNEIIISKILNSFKSNNN